MNRGEVCCSLDPADALSTTSIICIAVTQSLVVTSRPSESIDEALASNHVVARGLLVNQYKRPSLMRGRNRRPQHDAAPWVVNQLERPTKRRATPYRSVWGAVCAGISLRVRIVSAEPAVYQQQVGFPPVRECRSPAPRHKQANVRARQTKWVSLKQKNGQLHHQEGNHGSS